MNCYDIILGIIVPLISAIIGGVLTLGGVQLTIKIQNKKDEENKKSSVKPWIFSLEDCSNYKETRKCNINLSNNASIKCGDARLMIRNTENGIGIIDRVETEKFKYFPTTNCLLEKDTVTFVYIFFQEGETLKNMVLFVKDVYGNEYRYAIEINGTESSNTIKEIN